MSSNISFLYESELQSAEFNQRFADLLGGSVLSGYRFQRSTTARYINLIRGNDVSSVIVTNMGARIEEFADVRDKIFIEINATPTVRVDSIYAVYMHGGSNVVDYAVVKGYPNGAPVPMMNKEIYTFLGYVKAPPNSGALTDIDLLPVNKGIKTLDVGGKATFKNDVLVEGAIQIDRELLSKGKVDFEGSVTFKGKVTSQRYPIEDLELVTKAYVDALTMGLAPKEAVVVATTENISLIGNQMVDGLLVAPGDRVLVKNQNNPKDNGIYEVKAAAWERAKDADDAPNGIGSEVRSGMYCWVQQGTFNVDSGWVLTTDGEIILGTTPLTFVQFTRAGTPLADEQNSGLMSSLDKRRVDGYKHTQMTSSATWTVVHGLEKYPSVSVVDSGNSLVIGDVKYLDLNKVEIKFSAAFSGMAYLN